MAQFMPGQLANWRRMKQARAMLFIWSGRIPALPPVRDPAVRDRFNVRTAWAI